MLASTAWLESRFERLWHCSKCCRVFGEEPVFRRVYSTRVGIAVAALCEACEMTIPKASAADVEFCDHLERSALLELPCERSRGASN